MIIDSPVVINGTDISAYIEFRGLSWAYRYVTGQNGGLTLAGYTQLDILATKVDLTIKCRALTLDDLNALLDVITPAQVRVTYDDPQLGTVTKTMHPIGQAASFFNDISADPDAHDYIWDGISFKLEEL